MQLLGEKQVQGLQRGLLANHAHGPHPQSQSLLGRAALYTGHSRKFMIDTITTQSCDLCRAYVESAGLCENHISS